ncbi:MAG TPA: C25 family cysteine peptidase, partial [Roseiflexaceae bacterium]|nr:C25 family cysteine peptidase [Roseiflexaceae bacterium]
DVRDARQPVRLTNASVGATVTWQDAPAQPGRYALLAPAQTFHPQIVRDAPSNLVQGAADYLIVGYGPFLASTKPLADYYRTKGLRVATIDAQDAYDEFNGGMLHPEALRSFLRYAYANWARPAPKYLLLVGDGSYDFRDYIGMGEKWTGFLPPYLADVDPWMREAACDTCYGRLQTDDPRDQALPDLMVGRMPASSAAAVGAIVSKTVGYLTAPPPGGWRMTTVALVDNYLDQNNTPDRAGDFWTFVEGVLGVLPQGMAVQRFIYDPSPGSASRPRHYALPGPLRDDLFKALDSGAALFTYVGHANFWQWGFTSANATTSYLWYLYDADARTNGGKLPILLSLSCLTGYFHEPLLETTDERLLRWPNGGIVASFSPAGQGVATGQDVFARGALD